MDAAGYNRSGVEAAGYDRSGMDARQADKRGYGDTGHMKKIGIVGGLSAASTLIYYQTLCQMTQERMGGLNSPELVIRSLNFAPVAALMNEGGWDEIGAMLNAEAKALCDAGADVVLVASNTMHKLSEAMMRGVDVPFIHIADATASAVRDGGCERPVFLATRFTMEERFYLDRLAGAGLAPRVPDAQMRGEVNRIIFDELCRNEVRRESRELFVDLVAAMVRDGADSVILGCTEVCMLLNEDNVPVPVFDTTRIHCDAALRRVGCL